MKRFLAAAAATTTALLLATPASAGPVPVTRLHPATLERGADVRVPHLDGRTVVDGDTRIRVHAGTVRLLGTSGSQYVVGAGDESGTGHFRVLRLRPDGTRRVVLRGVPIWDLRLSGDGTQLGRADQGRRHTRVAVWDSRSGEQQTSRRFRGAVSILDLDESRMVLGGWGPDRAFWWNTVTGATRQIASRPGYAARISADRVATYTGDPYAGGCSVVTSLRRPAHRVWRSCRERVQVFSPRQGRMATIAKLADGLGAGDVWLRAPGGGLRAHYTSRFFGLLQWETERALLLETNGAQRAATVRCVERECERASRLRPVGTP